MSAALVALLAALCYALSTVCQHRVAGSAPPAHGLGFALLWQLVRRPLWLFGVLAGAAGMALQALALSIGQLVVVQPLLVSGMLFAIPASVVLQHRRPHLNEWLYAAVVVAGLTVFLIAAHPAPGGEVAEAGRLFPATAAGVGVLVVVVVLSTMLGQRNRAWLLGLAAGVAFGLASALLKQVVGELSASPASVLASWPAYAMLVVGLAGAALAQVSFQAGSLAASQPALTIGEPLVAIAVGWFAFGEQLAVGPTARAGQIIGFLLMSWAVLRLCVLTGAAPLPTTSEPSPYAEKKPS